MDFLRALPILLLVCASCKAHPLENNLPEILLQRLADTKPATPQKNDVNYRLPEHTVPINYDIELNPIFNEESFSFDGKSTIQIEVLKETKTLTFHVNDLNITKAELIRAQKAEVVKIIQQEKEEIQDFYVLTFENNLKPEKYTLKLNYVGNLNGDLRGFYRSNYTDDAGKLRWLATTHFEPLGARRAFPCWDEPAFKATFTISLKHTEDYVAVSNMPVDKISVIDKTDNKKWTKFQTTPKMSTYLVAFVVSDYGSKHHEKDENFSVWTRKNALDSVDYALKVGKKELTKLAEYTGIPFHLPKMDQISIPHFSAGAMENWGLVIYRESALLYKENVTTTTSKQSIAAIISHEFAHQWFGDLVSPKWWTYLWLNEGFATFFQYFTTDQVEDNWRMMEQFVVKVLQADAFAADAKENTRPMNHEVGSPDEISNLFDSISYAKAGSVIRMMSHILTEEVFKTGLNMYLKEMNYKDATSDDLFRNLQKSADQAKIKITDDKDIKFKTIMDTWVTQKGYPVLQVKRDYKTGKAEVTQQRFLLDTPKVTDDIKYWVPINYVTKSNAEFENTRPTHWLKPTDKSLELVLKDANDQWVLLNKQQTGYYRVNYDEENWKLITNQLNATDHNAIHVVNRAQLIDDALNLARSERLSYPLALDLTTYLDKETDYIPWVAAFSGFSFIDRLLKYTPSYPKFQQYMQRQVKNAMNNVGYEGKSDHISKLARTNMMHWSCYYGLPACNQYATEQFKKWLENSEEYKLPVDVKNTILCSALRDANEETWEKVFQKYQNSKDKEERQLLLTSLGCSSSEKILTRYLTLAFNDTLFETPNQVFSVVYRNSHAGLPTVLDFMTIHLGAIKIALNGSDNLVKHITEIGKMITSEEQLYKLTMIVVNMDEPNEDTHAGIDNALTSMRLVKSHTPVITKWLNLHNFSLPPEKDDNNSANTVTLTTVLAVAAWLMTRIY